MSKSSGTFVFHRHDVIGAYDAEHDDRFLATCFVDTGDLDVLLDCENPKQIVLGRTGSGKSALIRKLKERAEHVIDIALEALSLNYIANSTIIQFFNELGLNLDPFYKLLWRHVVAVEILKERFAIVDEATKLSRIQAWFESREAKSKREKTESQQRKALAYIGRYSETFWEGTEYRIKEITNKFETELRQNTTDTAGAKLGGTLLGFHAGVDGTVDFSHAMADKLSAEEKSELVHRAQEVVNSVQVRELTEIVDLIRDVLDDAQKRYYIVIDRLDESWADDAIRYRLIKALIDTVREFRRVPTVKIIIGMRIDLIDRVFRESRGPGFQEERYRSLHLPLMFKRAQLIELVDRRIKELIKDQYTTYIPTHADILPEGLSGKKSTEQPIDYLLARTWNRPRDVIEFFNICIEHAEGKAKFTKEIVTTAEGEYSRKRLRSLQDEWTIEYPELLDFTTGILSKMPAAFPLDRLEGGRVGDFCLKWVTEMKGNKNRGVLTELAEQVAHDTISTNDFRHKLAAVFYDVGVVGLKTSANTGVQWADNGAHGVSQSEIADDCSVTIHPALWRVLGVTPPTS